MSQVSTEFPNRWMEEFGLKRYRQGQSGLLHELVARKFGAGVADEVSSLLGRKLESARIHLVSTAVIECETAEEFLGRVRRELGG